MKTPLIVTFTVLTTLVLCLPARSADPEVPVASSSSAFLSTQQTNDRATVTFNGTKVWEGKVRKSVIAVSKSVDGKMLAAAFDGRKVIWENAAGAGTQLESERQEAARRAKKLTD